MQRAAWLPIQPRNRSTMLHINHYITATVITLSLLAHYSALPDLCEWHIIYNSMRHMSVACLILQSCRQLNSKCLPWTQRVTGNTSFASDIRTQVKVAHILKQQLLHLKSAGHCQNITMHLGIHRSLTLDYQHCPNIPQKFKASVLASISSVKYFVLL